MEYFTKVLWQKLNADCNNERALAKQRWIKNCTKYQKYLSSISNYLSDDMRDFLHESASFHDAPISRIAFVQEGTEKHCRITLDLPTYKGELLLGNVQKYVVSLDSFQNAVAGQLCWGYSEIKYLAKDCFRFSVIFDPQNELTIDFKHLCYIRVIPQE